MNNILIMSVAAKVLLVTSFKKALEPYGGKVFTADMRSECPAAFFGDEHFPLMAISAPEAFEQIMQIVIENEIGLIIPTRDGELPILAQWAPAFADLGVKVLVANLDVIATCQDKQAFTNTLDESGLPGIPLLKRDLAIFRDNFPIFIRPITGSAGKGTRAVRSEEDLPAFEDWGNILFHPFITAPEYSIDLLMGLEAGKPIQCLVRERQHVENGESKISQVINHPELEAKALELGKKLGLVGHNLVQAFYSPINGPLFIEINPRFGGASNLSVFAGLESPCRLVQLWKGQHEAAVAARNIQYGAKMLRYSQDVLIDPQGNVTK